MCKITSEVLSWVYPFNLQLIWYLNHEIRSIVAWLNRVIVAECNLNINYEIEFIDNHFEVLFRNHK